MARWGFFSGIIISVFVVLFFDFFDFFSEKPYSFFMTHRDEDSLLFLWPSCIILMGSQATGIDLLIPVGIALLINAIRYSIIFLVVGTLCNFSPAISKDNLSRFFDLKKKSTKQLWRISFFCFFVGSSSGFFILILSSIQAILYQNISGWGGIIIVSFLPLLETEAFWRNSDILLNAIKLILMNGIAYSLVALFIGIICNMFSFVVSKRLISS